MLSVHETLAVRRCELGKVELLTHVPSLFETGIFCLTINN